MNETKQNSLAAYFDEENKARRQTHRQRILAALEHEQGLTSREIARKSGLQYSQVWKRMSELHEEKKVKISGSKIENNQTVSAFCLNREPELFKVPKKLSKDEYLKKYFPAALDGWENYRSSNIF